MKLLNWTRTGLTAAVVSLLTCNAACAAESASTVVTVESKKPGVKISDDALGLSYETSLMLPNEQGVRYFRPDNEPLVRMFQTLGVRSLRIGGNSVDAARIPIPSDDDVHSLFRFARKAGVKVIYSVRLEDGDPKSAAHFTRLIRDHYADTLDLFAIGNEPKGYYKDTNVFLAKWTAIRDAMVAEWPAAKFCGPDDNPSPEWCRMMVANFGAPKGPLTQITQHSYSFGCSYKNPGEKDVSKLIPVDVVAAREKMLAPDAYAIYEKIYDGIRSAIDGTSLSFRMTEVNSYWFSGLKGASDSYAAALWGADYLRWWTSHGSDGLNFHTGDRTGGAISLPCRYAAFVTSENGYEARPLAYGMKLFSLAGGGRVLPVSVSAGTNNVVAYANLSEPNVVCVTVINKAHAPGAGNVLVQLKLDAALSSEAPRMILLESKNGDISGGSSDVRLGGAAIQEDGSWNGQWSPLPGAKGSDVSFSMPPASAAVVRFVTQ